ncbi:MAG: hypothetical protein HC880_00550 [Bacteroidia bacterium]|nr:hypothetical protein [Bacteroidia bacterium]
MKATNTLLLLVILFLLPLSPLSAGDKDPWARLVSQVSTRLRDQLSQNEVHQQQGQRDQIQSVLYLGPGDWVKDQSGTALTPDQLRWLNDLARQGMDSPPYHQAGFQIVYIDRFPILVESRLSESDLGN